MGIIDFVSNFSVTLTGGFAVYGLLCVGHVTFCGVVNILNWFVK